MVARTTPEVIREVERLQKEYEAEVLAARWEGFLMDNAAKTYLLHADHFVRWIRCDFNPGERNRSALRRNRL